MTRIEILADGYVCGYLLTISRTTTDTVKTLCEWRNAAREWFFDMRPVDEWNTRQWLEHLLSTPNRELFWITTDDGQCVGTYGCTAISDDEVVLGNLIRGRNIGRPRLIYYAEIALLNWLFVQGYTHITGECLSHNERVLKLHWSTGFVPTGETGLRREGDVFVPDENGTDARLITILCTPESFHEAVK